MKKFFGVVILGLMLAAGSASAGDFNYVQGNYTATDVQNRSGDSWGVAVSKELGSKLYVQGTYNKGIDSDFEAGTLGANVGFHTPVAEKADVYAQVGATAIVTERKNTAKYNYNAESGVRFHATPNMEFRGGVMLDNIRSQRVDSLEWRGFVGAEYALTKFVKVGVTAMGREKEVAGMASVRLYF